MSAVEILQLLRLFGYSSPLQADDAADLQNLIRLAARLDPQQRTALEVYLRALIHRET